MYHELVYHLDLCILSYHQHAQSLIWPFDPYYERLANSASRRELGMAAVRTAFDNSNGFHGPAGTHGWVTNNTLDPVVSRYDRLHPWLPAFTSPEHGEWLCYRVPAYITGRVGAVHVAHYGAGADPDNFAGAAPNVQLNQVSVNPQNVHAHTDTLYAFEGGTGAIGALTSNWTLLGVVLDRQVPGGYEVHIAFRGSRSGAGGRAMGQGLVGSGNPDWVTDMDFNRTTGDTYHAAYGEVCRGFARSVRTAMPSLLACLQAIHNARGGAPRNIYVTGHSLGGALATQFTSAVMVGTHFGPYGGGAHMPLHLRAWPWRHLRLITYSAPVAGNDSFRKLFDSKVYTRRVVLSLDPITQGKRHYHVGPEINISGENTAKVLSYHEPTNVRKRLLRKLGQWNDDIAGVPGPNDQHPGWPWKVYDSFANMRAGQPALQDAANLRTLLTGLDQDVAQYLNVLAPLVANNKIYKTRIRDNTALLRRTALANASAYANVGASSLLALHNAVQVIENEFSDLNNFRKILGFALILGDISRNPAITWNNVAGDNLLSRYLT